MHTFAVVSGQLRIQKILYANEYETHFFIEAVKAAQVSCKGLCVLKLSLFQHAKSFFERIHSLVLRIVGGLCLFDVLVDDVQHLVDRDGRSTQAAKDAQHPQ